MTTPDATPIESSSTSDETGFRVEVRDEIFLHSKPTILPDGIVTGSWREVSFSRGHNPAGIPEDGYGYKSAHSLLTYESAVALAWTLVAQYKSAAIECRIVKFRLQTSHTLKREGVLEEALIKQDFKRREVTPQQ